ncbi:MAG: acyl-CoA dehydrogenase family protein [Alphaproteobacteria bacterium]|nr:acyl-CoA dehydrogenase family protein [Alphaproteobacteria bacterium]
MDFELPEENRMLRDLVAKFVTNDLMPLENAILAREASGDKAALTAEELAPLHKKCKELGLWGLDVPEVLGGANIGAVAKMCVSEELAYSITPFTFPPDSPNLHMMIATVNEDQRKRYLEPYARGETVSAIAISEPGAGADPSEMKTRAVKRGNKWVINGQKIWISRMRESAFTIVMAVTDPEKKARGGITAFLVDQDNPGMRVARDIPIIGGHRTAEVLFEDCEVDEGQVLGKVGDGFGPMQLRLTIRRLEIGSWSVGIARRALDMMIAHANMRVTFGEKLADRQVIQWWIADAATKIHATRLMVQQAAWKLEKGEDVRIEASMIKVYGTEMVAEVVDHAMQAHGAMGMAMEFPLQYLYKKIRTFRIFEGPSEVHRWVVARRLLAGGKI